MNTDIRLKIGFLKHIKTMKLKKRLGSEAVLCLIDLWCYAAVNKWEGMLLGMSVEDIALAAGWQDDPDEFVSTLIDIGWLDVNDDGIYELHDWKEHQLWVSKAGERSKHAQKMSHIRWGGKRKRAKQEALREGSQKDSDKDPK